MATKTSVSSRKYAKALSFFSEAGSSWRSCEPAVNLVQCAALPML